MGSRSLSVSRCERRNSNGLSTSVHLNQLKTLQNQLAGMIEDDKTEEPCDDALPKFVQAPLSPMNMESKSRNHSERTPFLDSMNYADEYIDEESGLDLSSPTADSREDDARVQALTLLLSSPYKPSLRSRSTIPRRNLSLRGRSIPRRSLSLRSRSIAESDAESHSSAEPEQLDESKIFSPPSIDTSGVISAADTRTQTVSLRGLPRVYKPSLRGRSIPRRYRPSLRSRSIAESDAESHSSAESEQLDESKFCSSPTIDTSDVIIAADTRTQTVSLRGRSIPRMYRPSLRRRTIDESDAESHSSAESEQLDESKIFSSPLIDTSGVILAVDTRAKTADTTETDSLDSSNRSFLPRGLSRRVPVDTTETDSLDSSNRSFLTRGISRTGPKGSRSLSRGRGISTKHLTASMTNVFGKHSSKAAKASQMLPFTVEHKEESSLRPGGKWWHWVFLISLVSMLACIVTLWAPSPIGARQPTSEVASSPWSTGCKGGLQTCICPRSTICADDLVGMIFLTIARASAWFDYPLYMLLFLSKANNLNQALQKTSLRVFINFSEYHNVHSLFGVIVALESTSHAFFHILRWARRQNDIQLLWTTQTGITGMIAYLFIPIIVLPMTLPFLKKRMTFEWRKFLHYFSILWAVALMYHAPQRIFWMIGAPLFIYVADKLVEGMLKTHLIESCHFQRLGDTSCLIEFENPAGFGKQNSAYIYLMLPWISKFQYHAFTIFPSSKPNHSSICIYNSGDWTGKLLKNITVPAHKPAFVVGPFLSPFSSPAMDSENLVAVASGIGVTPAISLIRQYSSTSRRLNLVWICRDAGLIEHFLSNVDFGNHGYTLIYYTGKGRAIILRDKLPSNVLLFKGRPDLERTISGIIHAISSGEGLPEELSNKIVTKTPADIRSKLLIEKALSLYTMDQLHDYTVKASNYYNNEGQEPLVDTVNYQGMFSTVRHLLGEEDAGLVEKNILRNFEQVDDGGRRLLNRVQFDEFFDLMLLDAEDEAESIADLRLGMEKMNTYRDVFDTMAMADDDEHSVDEFDIKQYLRGNGKFSADKWSVLYCGGSAPIQRQLQSFQRKYRVPLSVEKFDW